MNPYASVKLPGAFKPFLSEPQAAQAARRHWLCGCEKVQQSWMRSTRDLFGHCETLLRAGQDLQNSALTHYVDWLGDWTGTPADRPSAAEQPAPGTVIQSAAPAQTSIVENDLTRIQGVGRVVQQRLNNVGVVSYHQIATWTDTEIAYIENNVLGGAFAGCVHREQWQAQAKDFLKNP